jgi:hypothetical protein
MSVQSERNNQPLRPAPNPALQAAGNPVPGIGLLLHPSHLPSPLAGITSYGLELVSHYLGLPFAHHAVKEDAVACATIVLRGCGEVGVADLTQLAERIMIRRGHLDPGKYTL